MNKKVHGDLFVRPTVKGSEVKKGQFLIYILKRYDLKNMSVIVSRTLYKAFKKYRAIQINKTHKFH